MKSILFTICVTLMLVFSCKSVTTFIDNDISGALDLPEAFVPEEGMSLDKNSCKNPMIDKRDGTRITMVSADNNQGSYQVPSGKYGLKEGELLRLDCSTGQVIGIVRKK